MDEVKKIESIKDKILDKIDLELDFINNNSMGGGDVHMSEVIKNLADAYVSLNEVVRGV